MGADAIGNCIEGEVQAASSVAMKPLAAPHPVPQCLNLVEVMLFELHSKCQNYLPCFTGVIPSAITYSVAWAPGLYAL